MKDTSLPVFDLDSWSLESVRGGLFFLVKFVYRVGVNSLFFSIIVIKGKKYSVMNVVILWCSIFLAYLLHV